MQRKFILGLATLVTVGLATSGCLSSAKPAGPASGGAETTKDTVEIMYAFSGSQSTAFQKDMEAWAAKNNVKLKFTQSDAFEEMISTRVASGSAPDIAIFPQPGILQGMAKQGKLAEVGTQIDLPALQKDIVPGFLDAATVNGKIYGAPMAMNGKSFYWYNKPAFEAKGYQIPKTHDELLTLVDKIKADGGTPFCFGLGSGSATGWPATDWIEDYMLQTGGTETYDKWVKGEIKFDSPEVRKAFDVYNKLLLTDGNVYGGAKASASNAFAQALNPMFDEQPKCWLGKQGNFITQKGFFTDEVYNNLDAKVGMFMTPSMSGQHPVLGGGDLAAAFTQNDANVKKVLKFMTTDPTFGAEQVKTGAWLSPLKSFDKAKYPNKVLRDVVESIQGASVFRFDGSDQMPGAVGSGSFWKGMVSYTSGNSDLNTTLKTIDAAWPA